MILYRTRAPRRGWRLWSRNRRSRVNANVVSHPMRAGYHGESKCIRKHHGNTYFISMDINTTLRKALGSMTLHEAPSGMKPRVARLHKFVYETCARIPEKIGQKLALGRSNAHTSALCSDIRSIQSQIENSSVSHLSRRSL
jgi:hypothetical protein